MNKTIVRPEWIPSAYTESPKEEKVNLYTDKAKVRLLKNSAKAVGRRSKWQSRKLDYRFK
jgi:hypothetical protein